MNKETGVRKTKYIHTLAIIQMFVATNLSSEDVSQAMNRRFMHHEFEQSVGGDQAPQRSFTPKAFDALTNGSQYFDLRWLHLLCHAVTFYLEFYLSVGVLRMEMPDQICGPLIINKIFETLHRDFYVPAKQLSDTALMHIRQIARAARIQNLVFQSIALETGTAVSDKTKQTVFSVEMFENLWRDQLYMTNREVVWAISLYASQLAREYERKIDMVLVSMMPRTLEVSTNDLVGPPDQLVALRMRPPPGANGGGVPSGSAVSGSGATTTLDYRYLATAPFASIDAACKMIVQKMMDRFREAIRPETIRASLYNRRGTEIESPYYRPVDEVDGSENAQLVPLTIMGRLHNGGEFVRIPASNEDVATLPIPRAKIPSLGWCDAQSTSSSSSKRKPNIVIYMSRAYIVKRYGMAWCTYDKKMLEKAFEAQHPNPSAKMLAAFHERMSQSASRRMEIQRVRVSDLTQDWALHHAHTDLIENPVMAAIQKVLVRARLSVKVPSTTDETEITRATRRTEGESHVFLVFTRPHTIRIIGDDDDQSPTASTILNESSDALYNAEQKYQPVVHFHPLMQLLDVRPVRSDEPPLYFENTLRPSSTAAMHLAAASAPRTLLGPDPALAMQQALGYALDCSPASIQHQLHRQQLGFPANGIFGQFESSAAESVEQEAPPPSSQPGNPPSDDSPPLKVYGHWADPENADIILCALRVRMVKNATLRRDRIIPKTAQYPADDIRVLIEEAKAGFNHRRNNPIVRGGGQGYQPWTQLVLTARQPPARSMVQSRRRRLPHPDHED